MRTKMLKCPGCFDNNAIRLSHFRWRDWPYRLVGIRSYRCMLCYQRFRAWGKPPATVELEHHRKHPDRSHRPRKVA
ncbi:MAG TPA: hypothetical protein VIY53_13285 [Acidobacteriaceae bacterium]